MGRNRTPKQEGAGEERGRNPVGKQVNVRIPPDLMADLELIAKDHGLDLSSAIRMILTQCRGAYVKRIREKQQEAE